MEHQEGIGLVLARATELRLKISDCIEQAATSNNSSPKGTRKRENDDGSESKDKIPNFDDQVGDGEEGDDEFEVEEVERLLHIRNAVEFLESQLSALQNLQERQEYEKQVALSEIDYSRKTLLETLEEYKGKDLDVIHETSSFVGGNVSYEKDLILPPYPVGPPISLVSENGYLSNRASIQKSVQNGLVSSNSTNGTEMNDHYESRKSRKGFGNFISSVAKLVIPIVGVISILSLSGVGPEIRKRGLSLKLMGFHQPRVDEESGTSGKTIQCPAGKILVVEDWGARCVVKERIEIPFESIVANRDVKYGYG